MSKNNSETRSIVDPILAYCKQAGIFARRRQGGAYIVGNRRVRSSAKDQADIWMILKGGRHAECEVKKPGEEPTQAQLDWLRDCANQGALAFWCTSLDEFIEMLRQATVGPRT